MTTDANAIGNSFSYRPALDGVRALAVIAVVIYHLDSSWLPGGYLGVDVFFVISGYLITSLLIVEHRSQGRIDLIAFWSRRVRRLLPALALMIVLVAVYYGLFVADLERVGLRGDLLAALFYVANWRFIASGQSYFQQYVSASPVRHTWSLAIEEQFYLVWPVVMMLLFRRQRLRPVIVAASVGVVVSVMMMARTYDPADPSRAYYGSLTRVHQILLGVILAAVLASPAADVVRRWGRVLMIVSGVVLIGLFAVMGDGTSFYYRGGSLLVAIATLGLIVGLEDVGNSATAALSTRSLVIVGTMSYGIYLWHWPVITVISMKYGSTSEIRWAIVSVLLTAVLTVASYRLLESPLRRKRFIFGRAVTPRWVLTLVPVTTLLIIGAIIPLTGSTQPPAWAGGATVPGILQTRSVGSDDGSLRVGVVGDSVMVSLVPGLVDQSEKNGFTLIDASLAACPVGYAPLYDSDGVISPYFDDHCDPQVRPAHDALIAAQPDVVIWHDLQSVLSRRSSSGELLVAGTPEWTADLVASWTGVLDRFLDAGSGVVIILPPLRSLDPPGNCANAVNEQRCLDIVSQDQIARAATLTFFDSVRNRPKVELVDLDDLLCPSGYPCPSVIDGVPVRLDGWDQTHFTEAGAQWLAPQVVRRIGVAGP